MKKVFNWIFLLIFVLILSAIFFFTGKQHKVLLTNKGKGENAIKTNVVYSIDNLKTKKIRYGKKSAYYIKGINHVIEISYKTEDKKEVKVEKEFKAKISAIEQIDIQKIIRNEKDWITYKKSK
ncbi:MAG: hypothetical protein Q7K48_02915 [Fusobacterium sp. JB021]|nr:hypothetical protein [Fusobacterium sp. JB021]MDP0505820.1 hypothetical protein [Fusobacterium sp. JB019]